MGVSGGMVAVVWNDRSNCILTTKRQKLDKKDDFTAWLVCICSGFKQYVSDVQQFNILRTLVLYDCVDICACHR